MAVYTVGAAGDYAFSQAGLNAAIAACSTDDTVRIIDAGTITLTAEVSVGTRITIEGDPALLDLTDLTTLPKLYTSSSIRAMDLDVAGISVKNLQLEGFPIDSAFGVGGAINAYTGGGSGVVGTFENLLFIDCVTCLQECADGTQRNVHAFNCGRLVRDCYGLDMAIFSIVQAGGYNYAIDAQWDKWSRYRLGAIYQPYYNGNDRAIRILADAGQPGLIQNVSVHRAGAGADGIAFTGEASHCTSYGYATVVGGGGVDNGNNESRDPLFVDPANGDFQFQPTSSEIDSGTAISGVSTDALGRSLPLGAGWPRGPFDYVDPVPPEIDTVTALSPTTLEVTWDTSMTDDADLIDAANYSVGNADIARVTRIDADTVHIHLDDPLAPGIHAVTAAGMTSTGGGTAAALATVTAARRIRTWLQGSHYQADAATVRLTVDPSGTPATYDWAISAGTVYKSLDLLLVSWQAALGTAAWVELVPDTTTHRAHVRVNTAGGETYSIAWSHAGDGTAIRDRLGETGNVSGRATATVWTNPVQAGWYGWHGATRLRRKSTRPLATRREMLSGTHSETQHGAIPSELGKVELQCTLRWGPPPGVAVTLGGHDAFEGFLEQLWDATGGGEPWSLYHLPDDEPAPERYEVSFADADMTLQPRRIGARPDVLFELELDLLADVAP